MTLFVDLRRWLGIGPAAAEPPPARKGKPVEAAEPTREEFERRLRTILRGQTEVVAGQINIIGLGPVREALGPRWATVAAKADFIARKAIERRLTKADVFVKVDGLNYLLILPQLVDDAARLKCALIAEEIAKHLLGEEFSAAHFDVRTAVARIDGQYIFEQMVSVEAVAQKLYQDHAGKPAEPKGETPSRDLLVYRPIWDVRRKALSTFICLPPSDGRLIDPPSLEELDIIALDRVINDLGHLLAARRTVLLALPVQYETLASSMRRRRYDQLCGTLPHLDKKLVVFEIVDVPQGLTQGRLTDLVRMLKPYARSVLLRVPFGQTSFRPSAETGVHAVGLDLAPFAAAEPATIATLQRFVPAANRAGLRTYMHGVRSLDLTRAALDAGFDYIDGDVITSVVDLPDGIQRFDESHIRGTEAAAS